MSDKELYRQKMQAKLDEWKADVDKLKAKASAASANAQVEMNKRIEAFESKHQEAKKRLSELAESSEDAWETVKEGVESSWGSLKAAFDDAVSKFKD